MMVVAIESLNRETTVNVEPEYNCQYHLPSSVPM